MREAGARRSQLREVLAPRRRGFQTQKTVLGNITLSAVHLPCKDFLLLSSWFCVRFALSSNTERGCADTAWSGPKNACGDASSPSSSLQGAPRELVQRWRWGRGGH